MTRLALSSAGFFLALAGCDAAADPVEVPEPAVESFALVFVPDADADARSANGPARYELTGAGGTAGANTLLALVTLQPPDPARPSATMAVYSQTGTAAFPSPGRYDVAQGGEEPILVRLTTGGRSYSPYRGIVTIESGGPTALRVRIDADVTTGGCGLLPSDVCSGPTLTGRLVAAVRAGADG